MAIATLRIIAGGGIDNSTIFIAVPKGTTDEAIMVAVADSLRSDLHGTPALENFDIHPSVRVSARMVTAEAEREIVEVTISTVVTFNGTFRIGNMGAVTRKLNPSEEDSVAGGGEHV